MLEVRNAFVAFAGASLASAVGGKRTRGKKQERAKQAQLILHYYAPLLKHFYQKTTPPHTAGRIFCQPLFLWQLIAGVYQYQRKERTVRPCTFHYLTTHYLKPFFPPPHRRKNILPAISLWGGKRVGYNIISLKLNDPQYE